MAIMSIIIDIAHNGALVVIEVLVGNLEQRARFLTYLIRKTHLQAEACARAPPIIGPIKDARARQKDINPLYVGSFVFGAIS